MKLLDRLFGKHEDRESVKKQLLTGTLKQVEVEGVKFYVRRLSAQFIFELQAKQRAGTLEMEDTLYSLLAAAVCDKEGVALFTTEEAKGLSVFLLNSLIMEAMDYNGLNPDAVDKARAALKNPQTQGGDVSITN